MEWTAGGERSLALLVDTDRAARSVVQPLIEAHGLELVQARSTLAALDLLQRMPERFRLALVTVEMPGLSGVALLETLRLFRPEIVTLCLASTATASAAGTRANCLAKPVEAGELRARLAEALAGLGTAPGENGIPSDTLARARASFAATGNLLDAARELARGTPEASPGW